MLDRSDITNILNKYKRKCSSDLLISIPILNKEGNTIAFLRPITADFRQTIIGCVELLDRWRKENPTLSPSRFPITHERTERWITDSIINNDERILFMIQCTDGSYVGHIGFTNIDATKASAEVDLVVRGEKGPIPGLMRRAMETLICWGKAELNLMHIDLVVLPYNKHAISFYKSCGFRESGIIPLIKIESNGEISWSRCGETEGPPKTEFYFLHMIFC